VEKFRKQVELAPDEAEAHFSLGEGLQAGGELEEALSEYRRVVQIDPEFKAAKQKCVYMREAIAESREESGGQ
jgi:predicted TPR repeat methyltransferase